MTPDQKYKKDKEAISDAVRIIARTLMFGLIAIAGVLGVSGYIFVYDASDISEATLGIGIIAFALLLAIMARMVQSHLQHSELLKEVREE